MSAPVSITIQVPRALRDLCDGSSTLALSAASVREALEEIERQHPVIHRGICDETGRLRPHIHLFVNSSLVRERQGMETMLESGDVITILPAVSGG
jgi:molybdopterin converting factor small subunit